MLAAIPAIDWFAIGLTISLVALGVRKGVLWKLLRTAVLFASLVVAAAVTPPLGDFLHDRLDLGASRPAFGLALGVAIFLLVLVVLGGLLMLLRKEGKALPGSIVPSVPDRIGGGLLGSVTAFLILLFILSTVYAGVHYLGIGLGLGEAIDGSYSQVACRSVLDAVSKVLPERWSEGVTSWSEHLQPER